MILILITIYDFQNLPLVMTNAPSVAIGQPCQINIQIYKKRLAGAQLAVIGSWLDLTLSSDRMLAALRHFFLVVGGCLPEFILKS
jgi:hypothetical protein